MTLGPPQPRIDGPVKVSGAAAYASDVKIPNLAFGVLLCSTIVKGRIAAINTSAASAQPGVLEIITHQTCPPLLRPTKPIPPQGQSLVPLQGPGLCYFWQQGGG